MGASLQVLDVTSGQIQTEMLIIKKWKNNIMAVYSFKRYTLGL